jgi:two-component system OmpR family sensor kinase
VLSDEGGRVRLEVTTPGARIAAAQCERLFDRFYRAPEVRAQSAGHGLGLALARHVARLHGGDVQCISAESEDVRFALQLPAWTADHAPSG